MQFVRPIVKTEIKHRTAISVGCIADRDRYISACSALQHDLVIIIVKLTIRLTSCYLVNKPFNKCILLHIIYSLIVVT
ncbi:MAG: hypothetical protein IJY83_00485 [Oscillospiraceae bacterium]|nr:hypothetical protein [Oscillospiraceae bacterium]